MGNPPPTTNHPTDQRLMTANNDQKQPPPAPGNEPFPLKWVFLAALLPALFGLSVGLFVLTPKIGFDPAAGLLTWMNFIKGGTWNTIPVPDPNDISQTIEVAVTWWAPGQYLFLGLLNLAGLSFGHAALLLSFLCTLSGAIGLAVLGKELGAPTRALPWIAASLACSLYSLFNFIFFSGGELLVMAIWPWIASVAWKLRNNGKLLTYTLPHLFLIGSFFKHSFPIYALCILLFLWSDRLAALNLNISNNLLKQVRAIFRASLPLAIVGIIYVLERHFLMERAPELTQKSDYYPYSLVEILGYASISPLSSIASLKAPLIRFIARTLDISQDETWQRVATILSIGAPLLIVTYLYWIKKSSRILRFTGITAITTVIILSTFHWKTGTTNKRAHSAS